MNRPQLPAPKCRVRSVLSKCITGGSLALIAVLIGIVAVGILKLVYLWRMAKLFREYITCE